MIFKSKTNQSIPARFGCGFASFVMLVVIALMMFNAMICKAFFQTVFKGIDPKILDPLQFISTVVLVFFEYWIYDRITRWFSSQRKTS